MASSTVNSAPVANSHSGNASVQNSSSRPTLRTSTNKSSDGGRRQTGSPADGGQRYVSLAFPLRSICPFRCLAAIHCFTLVATASMHHFVLLAPYVYVMYMLWLKLSYVLPIILSYIQTVTLLLFTYYRTIPLTIAISQAQQFSEGLDSRGESDYPTPVLSPAKRQHAPEDVVSYVH